MKPILGPAESLARVRGRGLLLAAFEREALLTGVKVDSEGHLVLETKDWDEYWKPLQAIKEYSEQGQRGGFWRLLGEFRGNTPASRAVFPDVPPSHCAPAGPLQPLTGPSGGPRPDLAHCAHVSQSVGPPPSAGCPSQKAAPDAPCSSPVPGSAPWRSQTPASLSGKGAPPWP